MFNHKDDCESNLRVLFFIMKKEFKFQSKSYAHLDKHKKSEQLDNLITNPDWVASHGFLPLIHVLMRVKRRTGCHKRFTFKERHIFYSSHTDSYIYQWYAQQLSQKYESYLLTNGFSQVPTAYRSLNGKCNIDFAKEAFSFLKKQDDAFVFVTDFHSFFDTLNHSLLKNNLKKVLNTPDGLEPDWYAVYKSLIKATYFDLDELAEYKKVTKNEFRNEKTRPKILLTHSEMKQLKSTKLHKYSEIIETDDKNIDKSKIGIPQGTSISAVFANVYMIDFDKRMSDYVNCVNGFYRRYSDDIIIVVPITEKENLCSLFETERSKVQISVSPKKTRRFHICNGKIQEVYLTKGESEDTRKIIEYLGFSYNGNKILIKDASLNKFYRKLDNRLYLLRDIKKDKGRLLGLKRFYRSYSHLGESARIRFNKNHKLKSQDFKHCNFITYVNKAARIMDNPGIKHQLRKHWSHITKFLHNI